MLRICSEWPVSKGVTFRRDGRGGAAEPRLVLAFL